ncbi:hypothetical protein RUE5091_03010 [Ruegeria denitrificans]|uniref:Uncharacterized protein n=1 Tax=Ruegeria denitrificans TaxID=1715692 RepID=A0A0P1IE85_9RHOB|nr:hypothetical protein RUE5091_03010 [Ruegeria denitrificans]
MELAAAGPAWLCEFMRGHDEPRIPKVALIQLVINRTKGRRGCGLLQSYELSGFRRYSPETLAI